MGNGPRRRAPPRPVSGAGEGESWDGVERSDMVCCNEKGVGGLRPRDIGKGAVYRGAEVTGGTRAVVVAPSGLGAKEKHRVPRVWPWCDETKIMARERRATWGCLTERAGGWGSQDSRGRGCEGSVAPARGAATHRAYRRAGPTGGATR